MKGLDVLKKNPVLPDPKLSPLVTNIDDSLPFEYENIFNKGEQRKGDLNLTDRRFISGNENPLEYRGGIGLDEVRAQRQSWGSKAGSGLGRIAVKAGTEIFKIPGVIGGIIGGTTGQISDLITGEDNTDFMEIAFNNSWIKSLSDFNEEINEEYLPVYVKKAVREGNLWDNITSIDFWATEGADGIGYIAAMLAPGGILKGLGTGKAISKLPMLKGRIGAQAADVTSATLANTILEAGAEAHHSMEAFQKELDDRFQKGEIDINEYSELLSQKSKLGRDVFLANTVILLGPNALQANMIWGKPLSKSVSKAFDSNGKVLDAVKNPKWYQKIGNRGKDIIKGGLPEGVWEEGMQSTVENMFSESAMKGELTDNFFNDFNLGELGNAYIDTISTTEGQKAMFLGTILGGGMKALAGGIQDIRDRKTAKSLLEIGVPAIQDYHTLLTTDIFDEQGRKIPSKVKEKVEALQSLENIQEVYGKALEYQDKESLETLRELAGIQLAFTLINQHGEQGLQFLEQYLNQYSQMEDIVQGHQNFNNTISSEAIIKNIMENGEKISKAKTDFEDFAYSLYNPVVKNKELASDPAINKTLLSSFKNKLGLNYQSNKIMKEFVSKKLKEIEPKYNQLLNEVLDREELEGRDRIKSESQLQSLIDSDIRLKQLHTEKNELTEELKRINEADKKFWDSKQIQKDFDTFVKQFEKSNEEVEDSMYQALNLDEDLNKINNAKTLEELENLEVDKNNPLIATVLDQRKEELQQEEDSYKTKSGVLSQNPKTISRDTLEENNFNEGDKVLNPVTKKESIIQSISDMFLTLQDVDTNEITNITITKESQSEEELDSFEPSEEETSAEDVEIVEEDSTTSNEKNDLLSVGQDNNPSNRFINYLMSFRDKKNDPVTFEINREKESEWSKNTAKAVEIYESGKNLSENREFLIRYLPIKFIYNNGEASSWSVYQGDADSVHPKTYNFRANIVDALIQGHKLEDLVTHVTNQKQGSLNTKRDANNKPVKNKVLDIDYIRDVLKGAVENLTLFHVNDQGNLVKVSENKNNLKINSVQERKLQNSKGNIFVVIKSPKGNNIPVKLNINNLNNVKASLVARLYQIVLKDPDLMKSSIEALKLAQRELGVEGNLYDDIVKHLNLEISLLGGKTNTITVEQIINFLVHTESKRNEQNSIVITKNPIDNSNIITYQGENYSLITDESLNNFTKKLESKRQNVITVPQDNVPGIDFKNHKYLEYLFNNDIITTDLETDPSENSFRAKTGNYNNPKEQGSELWISPAIRVKDNKEKKSTTSSTQKAEIIQTNKPTIQTVGNVTFGTANKQGQTDNNEDAVYVDTQNGVFILADGMGGEGMITHSPSQTSQSVINKLLGKPDKNSTELLYEEYLRNKNITSDEAVAFLNKNGFNIKGAGRVTVSTIINSFKTRGDLTNRKGFRTGATALKAVKTGKNTYTIEKVGDTVYFVVDKNGKVTQSHGLSDVATTQGYMFSIKDGKPYVSTPKIDSFTVTLNEGETLVLATDFIETDKAIQDFIDSDFGKNLNFEKFQKNNKSDDSTFITIEYDAEITASEQSREVSNDQIVDSLLKDYRKKLGRKLSKLSGENLRVEGGILMYDPLTNSIIENDKAIVSYEHEVIKVPGNEFTYSVWENKIKESIINNLENIRNIQKNSVSLQNNPKIENKVEVKGTEESKIKEKEVSNIEKQTAFKTYNDMLQQRDRTLTFLNRIKDPVKQTKLSETIKKLETDINNIALKYGFTKC